MLLLVYLMDDATARLPETNTILGSSTGQKVIHLLVCFHSVLQISYATKGIVSASGQWYSCLHIPDVIAKFYR